VEGDLPNGVRLEASCLRGIPDAQTVGRYPIAISVEDDRGTKSAARELVLEVTPGQATQPLQIVTRALPPGVIGREYDVTLAWSGGSGSVTWAVDDLPIELRHRAGRITGIPRQSGTQRIRITVKDSAGASAGPTALEFTTVSVADDSSLTSFLLSTGGIGMIVGVPVGVLLSWTLRKLKATRGGQQTGASRS
jgi:hypothetical protein